MQMERFIELNLNIIKRIKSVREERGYTQQFIAEKLGISQNAYSKIEIGSSKLTLQRCLQIADVLEVTIPRLFDINEVS